MSGAAFTRLGPGARAALRRVIEQALRAGKAHGATPALLDQLHGYGLDLVETAMILDAAQAEARAQDPHG